MERQDGEERKEKKKREGRVDAKAHYASCLQALCGYSISHIQSVIVPLGGWWWWRHREFGRVVWVLSGCQAFSQRLAKCGNLTHHLITV